MLRVRRPSPALAVASLALFVAVGGTATAAGVMITSSKQIKAGVIDASDLSSKARNQLKGATGPAGPAGRRDGARQPRHGGSRRAGGSRSGDERHQRAPGAPGAAGARGPSDVLVKRAGPIAAIGPAPGTLFTAHALPAGFPATAGPTLVDVSGLFTNANAAARTLQCSAVINGAPAGGLAQMDFAVPGEHDAGVPLRRGRQRQGHRRRRVRLRRERCRRLVDGVDHDRAGGIERVAGELTPGMERRPMTSVALDGDGPGQSSDRAGGGAERRSAGAAGPAGGRSDPRAPADRGKPGGRPDAGPRAGGAEPAATEPIELGGMTLATNAEGAAALKYWCLELEAESKALDRGRHSRAGVGRDHAGGGPQARPDPGRRPRSRSTPSCCARGTRTSSRRRTPRGPPRRPRRRNGRAAPPTS